MESDSVTDFRHAYLSRSDGNAERVDEPVLLGIAVALALSDGHADRFRLAHADRLADAQPVDVADAVPDVLGRLHALALCVRVAVSVRITGAHAVTFGDAQPHAEPVPELESEPGREPLGDGKPQCLGHGLAERQPVAVPDRLRDALSISNAHFNAVSDPFSCADRVADPKQL